MKLAGRQSADWGRNVDPVKVSLWTVLCCAVLWDEVQCRVLVWCIVCEACAITSHEFLILHD